MLLVIPLIMILMIHRVSLDVGTKHLSLSWMGKR